MICIYKIENPYWGVYIGQTSNYNRRVKEYRNMICKDQPRIYESLLRYGSNSHVFSVLHELPNDVSLSVRDIYEQLYMDFYRTAGFNLLNIRDAGLTGHHSEFSKKKMSEAATKNMTPEKIEKLRKRSIGNKNWLGKKHKSETIEKMKRHGGALRFLYGKTGGANPFSKKVIDVKTGKSYECVQDAANDIGMKYHSLQKGLSGYRVNKTTLKYLQP